MDELKQIATSILNDSQAKYPADARVLAYAGGLLLTPTAYAATALVFESDWEKSQTLPRASKKREKHLRLLLVFDATLLPEPQHEEIALALSAYALHVFGSAVPPTIENLEALAVHLSGSLIPGRRRVAPTLPVQRVKRSRVKCSA